MKTNIHAHDSFLRFRKEPTTNIRLTIITILTVCTALWAMPEAALGQVQGGSLFVADSPGGVCNTNWGSSIFQYAEGTQPGPSPTPSVLTSNLKAPRGLAFDNILPPNGPNLFVATNPADDSCDNNQGAIFKINHDGMMSTFATFPLNRWLSGLAIDSANNIFVGGGNNLDHHCRAPSTKSPPTAR